jgi:hypothetical protein
VQLNAGSQSYREFVEYLPEVKKYLTELEYQDLWWSTVAMVGKINNENIDPQLLDSIVETQQAFQDLRDEMIEGLIGRYLNQANSEIMLKAQAVIDILIRNLFERTADVGFLATDEDLLSFMAHPLEQGQADFIHRRIQEYVAKYTVYDDVLLVAPGGEVVMKLNTDNPVEYSSDPLLRQALQTDAEYVEVYRYSDLFPGKANSLIYAKKMVMELDGRFETVGVLCLSFDFEDEMRRLFATLSGENQGYGVMLLDEVGKVLVSNCPNAHPAGKQQATPKGFDGPVRVGAHLHYAACTGGYQGFTGLPWYGYVSVPNAVAFDDKSAGKELNVTIPANSPLYLSDLEQTNLKVSTLLLVVILNGKILSIKKDVKAFLPVLDSFQDISIDIQAIFNRFIHHIHQVLVKTIQGKVAFSAALSIEVMDRNLYERANDCRWWALNSTFRQVLSHHQAGGAISAEAREQLGEILLYINRLYTVYTNILLYDHKGRVVAVSNPTQAHWVGELMPRPADVARCLSLGDTQAYTVSDFHQSELYDQRYTYLYHAAIKSWDGAAKNVGGIALVFDSLPQFEAMLLETQPKYINALINNTTFSVFVDRSGMVLASTRPELAVGSEFAVPQAVLSAPNGENETIYWEWEGRPYLLGYRVSEGYREYKNGDGYVNDVLALVLTGI